VADTPRGLAEIHSCFIGVWSHGAASGMGCRKSGETKSAVGLYGNEAHTLQLVSRPLRRDL
jgi:hypothetical protein